MCGMSLLHSRFRSVSTQIHDTVWSWGPTCFFTHSSHGSMPTPSPCAGGTSCGGTITGRTGNSRVVGTHGHDETFQRSTHGSHLDTDAQGEATFQGCRSSRRSLVVASSPLGGNWQAVAGRAKIRLVGWTPPSGRKAVSSRTSPDSPLAFHPARSPAHSTMALATESCDGTQPMMVDTEDGWMKLLGDDRSKKKAKKDEGGPEVTGTTSPTATLANDKKVSEKSPEAEGGSSLPAGPRWTIESAKVAMAARANDPWVVEAKTTTKGSSPTLQHDEKVNVCADGSVRCPDCGVLCADRQEYFDHCASGAHREQLMKRCPGPPNEPPPDDLVECILCHMFFRDQQQHDDHLDERHHQKMLRKAKKRAAKRTATIGAVPMRTRANGEVHCPVCDTWHDNADALHGHLVWPSHLKELAELQQPGPDSSDEDSCTASAARSSSTTRSSGPFTWRTLSTRDKRCGTWRPARRAPHIVWMTTKAVRARQVRV